MPLIQVVDENDRPVGGASKQEIWQKGLYHRIIGVLILDENKRVLLQRRAATKQPYPNHWDLAVGGHVDEGEDYEIAAHRELQEETGIMDDVELVEIDHYPTNKTVDGRIMNRFNKRFRAIIDSSTRIELDPTEAQEAKWFSRNEIKQLLDDPSTLMTYTLRRALEHYYTQND